MEVSRWQRMQTIDALLEGYGSLSVPKLLELLAPEFHHQTLPESLGMPVRDRAAFAKHAAGIFSVFDNFQMIPKTVIDDAAAGVVAVDARMLGTLKGGKGEWENECVMMIRLTEDGLNVLDVREFVDSAKAMEMARTHAPKSFGGKATIWTTGKSWLVGWRDRDSWVRAGVLAVIMVGLHRVIIRRARRHVAVSK
ncbi:hypothetical protein HD806DRAFT_538243 [Xylariaceae sp. AK1471]|nr:hypothetical protein HD806DRAFT_538243 [Xylariaceae sp. AK1471]